MWRAFRALTVGEFWSMAKEAYGRNAFSTRDTWFQQLWIIAYSRADGHVLWRKPLGLGLEVPRNTAGTPTIAGNRVLISSPHSRSLHAFDAATGKGGYVSGFKVFESIEPHPTPQTRPATDKHPIQSLVWDAFTLEWSQISA